SQCQKPSGLLGRFVLWNMNSRHGKVTDWGLSQVSIDKRATVLDVGCGGGKTITKLANMASEGKVYGVDHSPDAVNMARKINHESVASGRVEVQEGSVSHLPFADDMFDVITAVETHFWWPDLAGDMQEVMRVLKPGGMLVIVAEIYKGASTATAKMAEKYAAISGMAFLSEDEHREMFSNAGCINIQIVTDPAKAWICCTGRKKAASVDAARV
ncbi:MAG TPA: class I SAM-dependent methyltransferase, partial [Candidatus Angelobacter sp.]|nr:class I SAM-dependent methyltransferase [Candidatus Angelobacter sp.]